MTMGLLNSLQLIRSHLAFKILQKLSCICINDSCSSNPTIALHMVLRHTATEKHKQPVTRLAYAIASQG